MAAAVGDGAYRGRVQPDGSTGVGALRAALLAVAVVGLAGAGHLAAGGHTPSWQAVVLSLLVVAVLCTAAASRRVPTWRLVAVVGGGQLVLHHAMSWGADGHHAGLPEARMVAGHAVATAVTVAVLRRGEAAVRALLAWALRAPLVLPCGPGPVVRACGCQGGVRLVAGRPVVATDPARGPPSGYALVA